MKLSTKWLSKFLSLDDLTVEEVAEKLTMGSFEVEGIHKIGPKLKEPIVIGKILQVQKHPNADRLSIAIVTTNIKDKLQIVCGAKNIKEGQLVPVSLEGAVVINRQDGSELTIKKTRIREIESNGMLCAPSELGIESQSPNEILILPESAQLGQSVIDYLSLDQDTVLEVAPRSNRGDSLSVYGLSKEISALTKKKLKSIVFKPPKFNNSVQNIAAFTENEKDTYLFYSVTIEGVTISESPAWLKSLLQSAGIRAINNIVDITNYINFTFGQPLHAYDKAKLNGNSLTARLAKKDEEILTIDGKLRKLPEGILVIADEAKPVAIAGVMGGLDTEVTKETKTIVLEAAVFNPAKVRRGARKVGISTEASKRFERGVDSSFTLNALLSAIELVQELATSTNKELRVGNIQQAGKPQEKEIKLKLLKKEIKRVLGIDLQLNEASQLLEFLGFKTKLISHEEAEVAVPTFRANDITRQIDIIEEIARLYGYNNIPTLPPPITLPAKITQQSLEKVKQYFLGCGFSESYISSLIGERILINKEFSFDNTTSINMINPLSKEHSTLRQTLIPGLLEALKLNQSYQASSVRLFEIGKIYFLDKDKSFNEKETSVIEKLRIAGIVYGQEENWLTKETVQTSPAEQLFFTIKGILETFFNRASFKVIFSHHREEFLHPYLALKISLDDMHIGTMGCIHPKLEGRLGIAGPVIVFEIDLEPIISKFEAILTYQKISSQPVVVRDITIDLLKKHKVSEVKAEIDKIASNLIKSINLISVFELDKEYRSLTYRLKMQSLEDTLSSQQIEDEVNSIKRHLCSCFQAKFRV